MINKIYLLVSTIILTFILSGCIHYTRMFQGGGRLDGDKYCILEKQRWNIFWLTIAFPSIMTDIERWSCVIPSKTNEEERSTVDWTYNDGFNLSDEQKLQQWIHGGEICTPIVKQATQRVQFLCNAEDNYKLFIQQDFPIKFDVSHIWSGKEGERNKSFPGDGNCTSWVVTPDGELIGPYLFPYLMDAHPWRDMYIRSRYRTETLFCFDSKTKVLYALYKENQHCFIELWQPSNYVPERFECVLPTVTSVPFYLWLTNEGVVIASWEKQTCKNTFSLYNFADISNRRDIISTQKFFEPPSPNEAPNFTRKIGNWLYIINRHLPATYYNFGFPFGQKRNQETQDVWNYIYRINIENGDTEVYYSVDR